MVLQSGHVDETTACQPIGRRLWRREDCGRDAVREHSRAGSRLPFFDPRSSTGPWSDRGRQRSQSACNRAGGVTTRGTGMVRVTWSTWTTSSRSRYRRFTRTAAGQVFNVGGPDTLRGTSTSTDSTRPWDFRPSRSDPHRAPGPVRRHGSGPGHRTGESRVFWRSAAKGVSSAEAWAGAGMKRVKRWLNTNPSSRELEGLYSRQAIYDWSKAARLLGYRPTVDLDPGCG